ncbi:MAG: hypothetical protein ACKPFD_18025 [Dolichospermum sp.]
MVRALSDLRKLLSVVHCRQQSLPITLIDIFYSLDNHPPFTETNHNHTTTDENNSITKI